ncbi:magnesium transporter [bacterium]|nr:magnesium transporter [bacterium]
MRKYNVVSVPVLDEEGRVVGRVTHDDILDVLLEESSEDFLMMAGTDADELTSRSVFEVARLRSPALLISLAAGFFMCTVVSGFEDGLNILFVAFMPLIPLMSGNTGNQASTVLIRGLATGHVRRDQFLHYVLREIRVGALIGVAFACITFVVVHLVFRRHDPIEVSAAVGVAVFAAVTFANLIGSVIPFVLTRIGLDPAIASGPVLTAVTDTSSLAIYLTVASVAASMAGLGSMTGGHP